MSKNLKVPLLRAMGHIYETSRDCKLQKGTWKQLKDSLAIVSAYFGVNRMQAFFIALIFAMKHAGGNTTLSGISNHLDYNILRLLEDSGEIYALIELGIFLREENWKKDNNGLANDDLFIVSEIEEAIFRDLPMPEIKPKTPKTESFVDFLEQFRDLQRNFSQRKIRLDKFIKEFKYLLEINTHFAIVQEIKREEVEEMETVIFLRGLLEILNGNDSFSVADIMKELGPNLIFKDIEYLQSFLKEENDLQQLGWLRVKEGSCFNDVEVELDTKAINILTGMGLHLDKNDTDNKDVVDFKTITSKELFFNPRETEELGLLQSMLMEQKFKQLRTRLKKKSLPQGITVLFFGYPGTGKTESVMQMARKSGREIFKVDISQTKSMWFGESEKVIKQIFTRYREMVKTSKRVPILLFNEADAIISKRKEIGNSGADQTENAIQNILLEELENFEGIFMATTNLVSNLDNAFDRRFLFKVEFDKPLPEVKAKIWQSKMPELSQQECLELALEFDLTGGQIDNIIRKCETIYVVHGKNSSMEDIRKFCRTESWHQAYSTGIGFKRENGLQNSAA